MPRSGVRSKKSRGKSRKTAATPHDPTPPAPTNAFAALAAPDQGEPSEDEEEEPKEQGQEEQDAAGADGALEPTITSTSGPPDGGAAGAGSSLAEDLLAAPPFRHRIQSAWRQPLSSTGACWTAPRRQRG